MIPPRQPRQFNPPPNPDSVMRGVCGTCKTELRVLRAVTAGPRSKTGLTFNAELHSAECPVCNARVYLMETGEVQPEEAVEKARPHSQAERAAQPSSVVDKMLRAMRHGQDIELTDEDEKELDQLHADSLHREDNQQTRFLLED